MDSENELQLRKSRLCQERSALINPVAPSAYNHFTLALITLQSSLPFAILPLRSTSADPKSLSHHHTMLSLLRDCIILGCSPSQRIRPRNRSVAGHHSLEGYQGVRHRKARTANATAEGTKQVSINRRKSLPLSASVAPMMVTANRVCRAQIIEQKEARGEEVSLVQLG